MRIDAHRCHEKKCSFTPAKFSNPKLVILKPNAKLERTDAMEVQLLHPLQRQLLLKVEGGVEHVRYAGCVLQQTFEIFEIGIPK